MKELIVLKKLRSIPGAALTLTAALIVCLLAGATAPARGAESYVIMVKDAKLPTDDGLEFRNLTLYMPLDESALLALGAELEPVVCEGKCFKVSSYDGVVSFAIDDEEMASGDGRVVSAPAPYEENGYYYVPAETFFSLLGFEGELDEREKTLRVDYVKEEVSLKQRLADALKIKLKEPDREKVEKVPVVPYAPSHRIDYTFENTTKMEALRVVGDKSKSSKQEKGDYYNQFNIRFAGLLKNGYDFNANVKTQMTTEPNLRRGELKKLETSWEKNRIRLRAYDIQPKFDLRYGMRNYRMQGVSYVRSNDNLKWFAVMAKTPKRGRQSKYARYVSSARVEKNLSDRRKMKMGMTHILVRDTGGFRDLKKIQNQTTLLDFKSNVGRSFVFKAEVGNSYNRNFATALSQRGTAALYNLDYRSKRVSMKNSYERTGSGFYSETSSFTRGRTELSSIYNIKTGPDTVFGQGYKNKKIKARTSKLYPTSFTTRPLGDRDNFKVTAKRNFEKTTGSTSRIIDTRELQLTDKLGVARVTVKGVRQKNKVPGKELAYRDQRTMSIKSPLTEKLGIQMDLKGEKWGKDRSSVTRQNRIKLDFEPKDWNEIALDVSRYYNTPQSARTTTKVSYQKIDIMNDREWKLEFIFDNYRDYNVKSLMLSYGFFR